LEGGGLAFELTEPALPVGGSGIDRTVARLAEMGIGIGLDNFGTGSSALSTLSTLEIDYVKLDGSFLATAVTPVGMSVNRAVVDLARALGLAVVGQGVENLEQLELLAELGCTLGQGFGLALPMALAEIPKQIAIPQLPGYLRSRGGAA
jgi:EAL domain-containing protein (putative c-di-GMP-specific phosphodiesterase class I)